MTTPNEPTTIGTCSKCGAYHGGWEPCLPPPSDRPSRQACPCCDHPLQHAIRRVLARYRAPIPPPPLSEVMEELDYALTTWENDSGDFGAPSDQWVNKLPQDALMTIITAYRDAYEEKHYPRGSAIPHEMGVEAARNALRSLVRGA